MADQKRVTIADLGLFTGAPQHENFCRVKDLLDTREMASSSRSYTWAQGDPIRLPGTYEFGAPRVRPRSSWPTPA
jgi:hypothetical protein